MESLSRILLEIVSKEIQFSETAVRHVISFSMHWKTEHYIFISMRCTFFCALLFTIDVTIDITYLLSYSASSSNCRQKVVSAQLHTSLRMEISLLDSIVISQSTNKNAENISTPLWKKNTSTGMTKSLLLLHIRCGILLS